MSWYCGWAVFARAFEADRVAMAYSNPELPVPAVLEIGDAFGESYAISERHYGVFLEDLDPALSEVGGNASCGCSLLFAPFLIARQSRTLPGASGSSTASSTTRPGE